ncbi:hypothetical protein ACFX2J_015845 [Malus domestica]
MLDGYELPTQIDQDITLRRKAYSSLYLFSTSYSSTLRRSSAPRSTIAVAAKITPRAIHGDFQEKLCLPARGHGSKAGHHNKFHINGVGGYCCNDFGRESFSKLNDKFI